MCHLRADICWGKLQWSLSPDGQDWQPVGGMLDASNLSDDFAGGFTGTFLGLCCQDLSGRGAYAEFDYFTYTEN